MSTHATTFAFAILDRNVRTLQTIMREYDRAERQLHKEKKYTQTQDRKAREIRTAKESKGPKSGKVPKVPKQKGVKPKVKSVGKITKK